MPSKKRKYNARFPAGRIKKIMQTDEEVGKVAQAVPIIISRTLELFVESLLGKAMQVTAARNAKTLSPSHVKQCILAEARFDFLRDLVKNIPDVSAAEEKEMMSAENSPNTSRFPDAAPRRVVREDSNSSGSTDVRPQPNSTYSNTKEQLKRVLSENEKTKIKDTPSTSLVIDQAALLNIPPIVTPKVTETNIDSSSETAIDLSTNSRPIRSANFYQETLITETVPHNSVIKINPIYSTSQPSTSFTSLNPVEPRKVDVTPKTFDLTPKAFDITAKKFDVTPLTAKTFDVRPKAFDLTPKTFDVPPKTFERHNSLPRTPVTPITPVINIDFSKNLSKPEIKVLDATAAVANVKNETKGKISRQNSKPKIEIKNKTPSTPQPIVDIDSLNSGNPQIDEDYDT